MKLITKEIEARFAAIGSQSQELDPVVVAKFFVPWGAASWFATEYNAEDNICFGYVKGLVEGEWNDEWGSFSIDELESIKGPLHLGVERDLHFAEQPFSQTVGKEYFERNFTGLAKKIAEEKAKSQELPEPQKEMVDTRFKKRLDGMKRVRAKQRDRDDDLER